MAKAHATVPTDPNDCAYKVTFASLEGALEHGKLHFKIARKGLTSKEFSSRLKLAREKASVPYNCTVCSKWHLRDKDQKPKNAP